jgi:hypothetical protein
MPARSRCTTGGVRKCVASGWRHSFDTSATVLPAMPWRQLAGAAPHLRNLVPGAGGRMRTELAGLRRGG